jgi:hypothetical protein
LARRRKQSGNWNGLRDTFPKPMRGLTPPWRWAYQAAGSKTKTAAALAKGRRLFPGDSLLRDFNLK